MQQKHREANTWFLIWNDEIWADFLRSASSDGQASLKHQHQETKTIEPYASYSRRVIKPRRWYTKVLGDDNNSFTHFVTTISLHFLPSSNNYWVLFCSTSLAAGYLTWTIGLATLENVLRFWKRMGETKQFVSIRCSVHSNDGPK